MGNLLCGEVDLVWSKKIILACVLIADFTVHRVYADEMQSAGTESAVDVRSESTVSLVPNKENAFDILEFNVKGNTVLANEIIEKTVYPFLGEKRSIDDAESARTALEKAYHEAGYLTVLVNIPEQKVDAGVVVLEVVESKVDVLRVTGSHYYSLGRIKAGVPELAEGKTPHFPTMQKQLEALNRSPDRSITPVMKAGRTPGTVSMELKVNDKLPLHASVNLNNNYSADTTELRAALNLHYDNLWQLGHSLNLSFLTTPQKISESKVFFAAYSVPLDSGDTVSLKAIHNDSDVAALNTLNVVGNGNIFGVRYAHPLPLPPNVENFFHNISFDVEYKDFGQTVNLQGVDSSVNSPITYMPFAANYEAGFRGKSSITTFGVNLNTHFRGLVGEEQDFRDKRFKAHANYVYLRGNIAHMWRFENDMKLDVRLSGQLTDQPLISNEQISLGGADNVRGYLQSEVLGDIGYSGAVELSSPKFGRNLSTWVDDLHALGFVDFGEVVVLEPLASQRESYSIASTGLGLRLKVRQVNAQLDFAVPLNDGAANRTKAGDSRLHFGIDYAF